MIRKIGKKKKKKKTLRLEKMAMHPLSYTTER